MFEMKLGPLMLFVLLLLILVAASFYSCWANGAEGFAADTNPFSSLSTYDKYYKNLVKDFAGLFSRDNIRFDVSRFFRECQCEEVFE